MKDSTTTPVHDVSTVASIGTHNQYDELHISDLYSATHAVPCYTTSTPTKPVPFIHPIALKNPDGTETCVRALFDDGAMTGAMCSSVFSTAKYKLKGWRPSTQALRMANGTIIPSEATWTGTIRVENIEATGTFKVFNSGSGWSFLFGKPLLQTFRANHDYSTDEVTISNNNGTTTLHNRFNERPPHSTHPASGHPAKVKNQDTTYTTETTTSMETTSTKPADIFTRQTDPFAPPRVEYIVRSVKIGKDISPEEREEVTKLLTEFADVFACLLKEVLPIPEAQVDLTILEDATFRTTVHQRPMNPPQRQFMNKWVDEMLEANLIEHADIPRIKHVAPTVLTQKVHDANGGMTLADLQHELNWQCEDAKLPLPFESQHTRTKPCRIPTQTPKEPPKWRVTQNFAELNKVTQIPPMFQGDIHAKQQRLSGHWYVSVFDFASGFYAIEIPDRWRPYFTFFVDGRGYLWYKRMAMGWTGAPTVFSATVTRRLHDILTNDTMELFVDDGGCTDDTFTGMVSKLRQVFQRCREHKLSLSPTKCRIFMTETTFAGATVGPQGVQPDLAKLSAVVNWKQPDNALNLLSFLGLTGHFRDLIKGYSKIEGPL